MFQVIKDITDTIKEEGILEWEKFLHCISHCSIFHWNYKKKNPSAKPEALMEDSPREAFIP